MVRRDPAPAPAPEPAAQLRRVGPPEPVAAEPDKPVARTIVHALSASWQKGTLVVDPQMDDFAVVRVLCREGDRLIADTNQLFERDATHRGCGTFIGSQRERSPCQIELFDVDVDEPLAVACAKDGASTMGPCDPPLVPAAPADGVTAVDDLQAKIESHGLFVEFALRLGAPIHKGGGAVVVRAQCGAAKDEIESRLSSVFDVRAGESWWLTSFLFQRAGTAAPPCRLDIALRERPVDKPFDWTERPLGTWCLAKSKLRPGAC